MSYTTTGYQALCDEAAAGGHILKLGRSGNRGWGLQLLVAPVTSNEEWRAAGALFGDLDELDGHATFLLAWVRGL